MAVASQTPVDYQAQRAELDQVLRSSYFTRAPKLACLLSYLCEKRFAGEAHLIKEYSVGVEVFHRGDTFDQDSDSIVRVEANRLRKRLAEYYAGEGASHPVHITIPVGQYVPEFSVVSPSRGETLTVPEEMPPMDTSATSPPAATRRLLRSGRAIWWMAAALLLLTAGTAFLILWMRRPAVPVSHAAQPLRQPADMQIGPPTGEEIRILAGSSRSFVDHAGRLWNADTWFEGGAAVKSTVQHIWRTQDPGFYRASRQGDFRYKIPLKPGIYELRLHFAETVFDPESTETGGEGSRIFTVMANGKPLLAHFDVVADAGASRTADVKIFHDIAPAKDGFLYLGFSGDSGKQAVLSAIEILPGVQGRIRPVRLLTRQTPYYSNNSHWWSPDNYFEGGQMATYAAPVSGTDDPELYESERWGNFSYAIPVGAGKYSVSLYFAARHNHGNQPVDASDETQSTNSHIFNVFCNGRILLKEFDLAKETRQSDVVVRKFTGLESSAQNKLLLSFVPVKGYATVTGIEVLPE